MRRTLAVVLAVLGVLGVLAPSAFAQAPSPKVTIDGFIDQTTSWSQNMSIFDLDATKDKESEWYGRTRGEFQITGEVGKVKGFLKFQQDNTWGNVSDCNGLAQNCTGTAPFARRDGALNTELAGNVEMLWIYTEFPFSGPGSLLPFVPMPGTMRLGLQPFQDETYKLAALAVGQFGGAHIDLDLLPGFTFKATYAQVEEAQTGARDGFFHGDDFAVIFGLEMTPLQGLSVKPIYAYYYATGTGGGVTRPGRGGVADSSTFFGSAATNDALHENRHTIGVDAKWQAGPFSLFPTILYQFGDRDIFAGGVDKVNQDFDAWFIDIRGGWRSGPLEVEGLFLYTTGNDAKDNVGQFDKATRKVSDVNFYQPIDTYSGFAAGWGAITALMHDYLVNLFYNAGGLNPATSIGYDKYGRLQVGLRAFYSVTPTFKLRGVITPLWTAEEVDTRSVATKNNGLVQLNAGGKGKDDYIGTEVDFGFDWNFAPNISLYTIYGHLFAGDALSNQGALNSGTGVLTTRTSVKSPSDVDILTAVVRYSF